MADLDVYQRAFGSTFMDTLPGVTTESPALHSFWAWSAGAMKNVTPRDAVGAVATYGHGNDGRRVALEGRYRRWISLPGGSSRVLGSPLALDLSAGVVQASVGVPREPDAFGPAHTEGVGLTTGASLGLMDWAALTGRADVVWAGESASAFYAGVELGTLPGLLFSAAVLAILAGTST